MAAGDDDGFKTPPLSIAKNDLPPILQGPHRFDPCAECDVADEVVPARVVLEVHEHVGVVGELRHRVGHRQARVLHPPPRGVGLKRRVGSRQAVVIGVAPHPADRRACLKGGDLVPGADEGAYRGEPRHSAADNADASARAAHLDPNSWESSV